MGTDIFLTLCYCDKRALYGNLDLHVSEFRYSRSLRCTVHRRYNSNLGVQCTHRHGGTVGGIYNEGGGISMGIAVK